MAINSGNIFLYGERFQIILELANRISDYQQYKEEYATLISKNEKDDSVWDVFLCKFYSRAIEDGAWGLIQSINKKVNTKQDFSSELSKLRLINKKSKTKNLNFEELSQLKEELLETKSKADDKLKFDKLMKDMERKDKWKERFIGFVVGLIVAVVVRWIFT